MKNTQTAAMIALIAAATVVGCGRKGDPVPLNGAPPPATIGPASTGSSNAPEVGPDTNSVPSPTG